MRQVEFRKIAERPSFIANDPLLPLSHLALARALTLSGDKASAQSEYQRAIQIWKDADPDFTPLKAAKDELTKLLA